jgi:hypothetical protein
VCVCVCVFITAHPCRGDCEALAQLLERDPAAIHDRDVVLALRGTPLTMAAWRGHTRCVEVLLAAGAQPHKQETQVVPVAFPHCFIRGV